MLSSSALERFESHYYYTTHYLFPMFKLLKYTFFCKAIYLSAEIKKKSRRNSDKQNTVSREDQHSA